MSFILALLQNAWTGFSPLALIAGLSGIGLLVVAFLGLSWLPGFLKRPLIAAGVLLLASAAIYQAGTAKGAHDAFALDTERALAAETTRADLAQADRRRDRAQAIQDLATERADKAKLKDLLDAVHKRPDAGRLVLPRDLARRLRDL